jgi:hypothetical protein
LYQIYVIFCLVKCIHCTLLCIISKPFNLHYFVSKISLACYFVLLFVLCLLPQSCCLHVTLCCLEATACTLLFVISKPTLLFVLCQNISFQTWCLHFVLNFIKINACKFFCVLSKVLACTLLCVLSKLVLACYFVLCQSSCLHVVLYYLYIILCHQHVDLGHLYIILCHVKTLACTSFCLVSKMLHYSVLVWFSRLARLLPWSWVLYFVHFGI